MINRFIEVSPFVSDVHSVEMPGNVTVTPEALPILCELQACRLFGVCRYFSA
jgi:hypothetical protein